MTASGPDGTNLFYSHRFDGTPIERVVHDLIELNQGRGPRPVHKRLERYRTLTEQLIDYYGTQCDITRGALRQVELLTGDAGVSHRRRWTAEQDEALIETACLDQTLIQLALHFNRTPTSIAARLSYLVGARRISYDVVAKVTGEIDGEPVDGVFAGTITKLGKH